MPEIHVLDTSFNNIEKKELSIQVNLNGFSFLIKNAENNKAGLFRHYSYNNLHLSDELIRKVEQTINKDEYLSKGFDEVQVYYNSNKYTLLPQKYFDPQHLKRYLEFNHSVEELEEIHYNYIPELKLYVLFTLPNYLSNLILQTLGKPNFIHNISPLLSTPPISSGWQLNLDIGKENFSLIIRTKEQLWLANSYAYSNPTDLLYFMLYACKQIKTDQKRAKAVLSGNYCKKEPILHELKKHVAEIAFIDDFVSLPPKFDKLAANQFFNLFKN